MEEGGQGWGGLFRLPTTLYYDDDDAIVAFNVSCLTSLFYRAHFSGAPSLRNAHAVLFGCLHGSTLRGPTNSFTSHTHSHAHASSHHHTSWQSHNQQKFLKKPLKKKNWFSLSVYIIASEHLSFTLNFKKRFGYFFNGTVLAWLKHTIYMTWLPWQPLPLVNYLLLTMTLKIIFFCSKLEKSWPNTIWFIFKFKAVIYFWWILWLLS